MPVLCRQSRSGTDEPSAHPWHQIAIGSRILGMHYQVKKLLTLAAVAEATTGLALLVVPALVGRLLLGAEFTGAGIAMSRVAGIALFGLGLACWPGRDASVGAIGPLRAMLAYNLLATLYLAYLGIGEALVGPLLRPAVAFHGVFTLLLILAWRNNRQGRDV